MKQKGHTEWAVLLMTVLRAHYYRQKKQKPQIDFLRFLCYNLYVRMIN